MRCFNGWGGRGLSNADAREENKRVAGEAKVVGGAVLKAIVTNSPSWAIHKIF